MPQLEWDEIEFLECLEVIPEIDEDRVTYVYNLEQNQLVLTVIVWPLESVISLSLRQQWADSPITEFALFVRGAAQYIHDKRGCYLSLRDCVILPNRFAYLVAGNVFDKINFRLGITVEITVKPRIQIRYVSDP